MVKVGGEKKRKMKCFFFTFLYQTLRQAYLLHSSQQICKGRQRCELTDNWHLEKDELPEVRLDNSRTRIQSCVCLPKKFVLPLQQRVHNRQVFRIFLTQVLYFNNRCIQICIYVCVYIYFYVSLSIYIERVYTLCENMCYYNSSCENIHMEEL